MQGKPEMGIGMMKRAKRRGLDAEYLVADAWFGTKTMIRAAYELGVCAVLRMKKGSMKYRVMTDSGDKQFLDAQQLYAREVKRRWRKVRGMPWRAVAVEVELDVSEGRRGVAHWKPVQLLFVRGVNEPGEPEVGKKNWALFLCTDAKLGMSKVLEVYALRWGVEVYFKEAKQHLGFLAEQTKTFASHIASIHLCAIRYLMLVHAKLECGGARIGEIRAGIEDRLNALSFAGRLWQLFRAIISGTLDELGETLGCSVEALMMAIDDRVNRFFEQSLQLDVPVSCIRYRPVRKFTAQNTEFSGRNRAWLKFTASEDEPHAPTVVLARHSRESGNSLQSPKISGFPLSRERRIFPEPAPGLNEVIGNPSTYATIGCLYHAARIQVMSAMRRFSVILNPET